MAAIDCCKVNGTVVYSTCSVSPLENEEVVNYALKRRFIKIVDCGVILGWMFIHIIILEKYIYIT